MAAVVESVFQGKTCSNHVLSWLTGRHNKEYAAQYEFLNDGNLKADFIPYLLNYLREQSTPLITLSQNSGTSPVKTPRSLSRSNSSNSIKNDNSVTKGSNRVKLFTSPGVATDSVVSQPAGTSQSSTNEVSPCREQLTTPGSWCSGISPLRQTTPRSCKSAESSPHAYSPYSPYFEGTNHHIFHPPGQKSTHRGSNNSHSHNNVSPEILQSKGHKKKSATNSHHDDKHRTHHHDDKHRTHHHDDKHRTHHHDDKHRTHHHQYQPSPGTRRKSGNKRRSNPDHKDRIREMFTENRPVPSLQLDNLEDFPPIGAQPAPAKATATRRIKPTPVTGDRLQNRTQKCFTSTPVLVKGDESSAPMGTLPQFSSPKKTQPSLVNHTNSVSSPRSLEEERELLRIARQKQKIDSVSSCFSPSKSDRAVVPSLPVQLTPTKPPVSCLFKTEIMEAKKDRVTYITQLNSLAELYSGAIQEFLVPSVTVELYFIIQLLTVKGVSEDVLPEDSSDSEDINYLQTVHNCVHFAVAVLSRLHRLLAFLDKTTLRLLSDNPRVCEFSSGLKTKLLELSEASQGTGLSSKIACVPGVAFQADTDNRTNFPNDKSFHLFKKQRDTFYELIREWEDNHHKPGWTMKAAMAHKVWQLVHHQLQIANFAHFVRLFQSQLIKMCKGGHSRLDEMNNTDDMEFLQHLKKNNPEKLKRLQERFIMPLSQGGPSPSPTFTGPEEFFHNFVVIADSHIFNQHLMESLSAKILQLTGSSMDLSLPATSDDSTTEPLLTQEQRDGLQSDILSSKLLGKFLGLVVFLPYQCPDKLPAGLESSIVTIRNQCSQPLDVLQELKTSIKRNQLIITLPWIIDYLSMMDTIAPHLQYYQTLLDLLLQLYKFLSEKIAASKEVNCNYLFMLLLLGWFFEIPVFPEGFFFKLYDQNPIEMSNNCLQSCTSGLDSIDLIDTHVLYLCCPYLSELRLLLLEAVAGMKSQGAAVKKITPIAADHVEVGYSSQSYVSRIDKRLQNQLVENFYHNQPQSVQKTIDFVSERIASNCKEQIENRLLIGLVQSALTDMREKSRKTLSGGRPGAETVQKAVAARIPTQCSNAISTVRAQCKRYCQNKCQKAMKLMLSEGTKPQVLNAASTIAAEIAYEKLHPWIQKDFAVKMAKRLREEVDKFLSQNDSTKIKTGLTESGKAAEGELAGDGKTKAKEDNVVVAEGSITNNADISEKGTEVKSSNQNSCAELVVHLKNLSEKILQYREHDEAIFAEIDLLLQEVNDVFQSNSGDPTPSFTDIVKLIEGVTASLVCKCPVYFTSPKADRSALLQTLVLCHKCGQSSLLKTLLGAEQLTEIYHAENAEESWQGLLSLLQALILNGVVVWNDVERKLLQWMKGMEDIAMGVTATVVDWMRSMVEHDKVTVEAEDMMDLLAMLLQKTKDFTTEMIPPCFENVTVL